MIKKNDSLSSRIRTINLNMLPMITNEQKRLYKLKADKQN